MDRSSLSVLWVNHFAILPGEGGGTRHFEMGRELARRGWDVTIAASDFHLHSRTYTRRSDARDRATIDEAVEGVNFRWLWAMPYRGNDWRRLGNWVTFGRSVLQQRRGGRRFDVVIGSSPHLFAALAAERLAAAWRVPFVLEVRDLWPESMVAAGGRKGLAYNVFDRIARYLYRRADRIVVLARGSADYLEARGIDSSKLVYVPNGVDPEAFAQVAPEPRQGFTLVYAGAHGPANGLETVLEAAESLAGEPGLTFRFLGDGPSKAALAAGASARGLSNVEFLPPVPKRDIPAALAAADAGLMVLRETPLFSFGVSPNKLFDYFGAGLPVVCNVPGEVAGMVSVAGGGEQATDGSGRALAEAIVRLRQRSPQERIAMGRSARAWVAAEHGRSVLADRLDGVLRGLVSA